VIAIGLASCAPFYRDDRAKPHGTGTEEGHYSNGSVRTRTYFRDGREMKAEWYSKEGVVIMTTLFDKEETGPGIILDDNGVVRLRGTLKKGMFDGDAESFDDHSRSQGFVAFRKRSPRLTNERPTNGTPKISRRPSALTPTQTSTTQAVTWPSCRTFS